MEFTLRIQALKTSLKIRLDKWYDFRRHIAFRCKVVFQYHLSNRGYYGKVMFNHSDQTLQLKVSILLSSARYLLRAKDVGLTSSF